MRGGARNGAGRKTVPDQLKRETVTVRLPRWMIDMMPKCGRGRLIENAINRYLLDSNQTNV